jgi:hypothetical protein
LYLVRSGLAEQQGIYAGSIDGTLKKRLLPVDTEAVYATPGYLLYLDGYTLQLKGWRDSVRIIDQSEAIHMSV